MLAIYYFYIFSPTFCSSTFSKWHPYTKGSRCLPSLPHWILFSIKFLWFQPLPVHFWVIVPFYSLCQGFASIPWTSRKLFNWPFAFSHIPPSHPPYLVMSLHSLKASSSPLQYKKCLEPLWALPSISFVWYSYPVSFWRATLLHKLSLWVSKWSWLLQYVNLRADWSEYSIPFTKIIGSGDS